MKFKNVSTELLPISEDKELQDLIDFAQSTPGKLKLPSLEKLFPKSVNLWFTLRILPSPKNYLKKFNWQIFAKIFYKLH